MIRFKEERHIKFDEQGRSVVDAVILVSSSSDLPDYDKVDGRVLVPGSVAVIPSTGAIHMLDFDNTWKEW